MKNKRTLFIVLIIVAILVVLVAVWGKNYYDDRYVGEDYYTVIPESYDILPKEIYDMSGDEVIGMGIEYTLTAYNENGESKTVKFTVFEDKEDIPEPGDYLKVSASNQIVLKWDFVEQANIPKGALESINNG